MKNVIIFGSTGSVGVNALRVIRRFSGRFRVVGLSANVNIDLMREQISEFKPETVVVVDAKKAKWLSGGLRAKRPKVLAGPDGLCQLAAYKDADFVVMAISTNAALMPLLAAIDAGKTIALASKEPLVSAGSVVIKRAEIKGVKIIPIDSEHSAIFQCLNTNQRPFLKRIYLTASGGPLRKTAKSKMHLVTPQDAIRHPKWLMGKKISVDSATMINKGLEAIEAMWLFGIADINKIKVVVHPEAVVHSMVEFTDGSVIAQMGPTDMRLPIQYALTYPERVSSGLSGLDFNRIKKLTFDEPNFKKFPCLGLAYEAARQGRTMPAVLNAANEELVKRYLKGEIKLTDIAGGIEKAMKKHRLAADPCLDEILKADKWAREQVNLCYRQ